MFESTAIPIVVDIPTTNIRAGSATPSQPTTLCARAVDPWSSLPPDCSGDGAMRIFSGEVPITPTMEALAATCVSTDADSLISEIEGEQ